MHTLFTCLSQQHDPSLICLAVAVCVLGTTAAVRLGYQVSTALPLQRQATWAAAAVLATASAIWATHFIAMLAFNTGVPACYDLPMTMASFLLATLVVGAGAQVMARLQGLPGRLLGGAIVGAAISAMHYAGMAAFNVQGRLSWDGGLVLASVLSGILFSAVAAAMAFGPVGRLRWTGPVFLSLAVCVTHFLGMAAATVVFDPSVPVPQALNRTILAVLVANVAALIVGLVLASLALTLRTKRQLEGEESRLHDFAEFAVEGLLICDGAMIVAANSSLELLLGRPRTEIVHRRIQDLLPALDVSQLLPDREMETQVPAAFGTTIPVRITTKPIFIGSVPHTVIAIRDQRERLRNEAEMMRLAHSDPLTGLDNRRSFLQSLRVRCESQRSADSDFALLYVDLDRFKTVNDSLGHDMGEQLLRRVANRLRCSLRKSDTLARLGGDEFAVIMTDSDLLTVQVIAERIIDMLCRPFVIDGHLVEIGGSIGVALSPEDGTTPEQLTHCADLALYRAKEEGRGVFRLFEPAMNARIQAKRLLEVDLRRALSREELEVHFQPLLDTQTGRFAGAEALARWRHPQRGLVPPADFIPLAEETGLINAIGDWVLRRACREAATWPQHLSVSVNVSPIQFKNPRIVSNVAAILAETGLPAWRLELEVTETALMNDDGCTLAKLTELRALGIAISMDDFGTGYSSLSTLRRFPFDKIKVDQSFVSQVASDEDSAAIVSMVALLGIRLGLKLTAEGVETPEQREFVASQGYTHIQGYLISKPLPAAEAFALFCNMENELAAV